MPQMTTPLGSASEPPRLKRDDEMTPCMALEDLWI